MSLLIARRSGGHMLLWWNWQTQGTQNPSALSLPSSSLGGSTILFHKGDEEIAKELQDRNKPNTSTETDNQ